MFAAVPVCPAAGSVLTLDKLSVEGTGWEALNETLHALNEEMMEEFINSGDRDAWENDGCTVGYEAQIRRSDEEIVSIYCNIYEDAGGESSYIHGKSANFETKSGRRLSELADGGLLDFFLP